MSHISSFLEKMLQQMQQDCAVPPEYFHDSTPPMSGFHGSHVNKAHPGESPLDFLRRIRKEFADQVCDGISRDDLIKTNIEANFNLLKSRTSVTQLEPLTPSTDSLPLVEFDEVRLPPHQDKLKAKYVRYGNRYGKTATQIDDLT